MERATVVATVFIADKTQQQQGITCGAYAGRYCNVEKRQNERGPCTTHEEFRLQEKDHDSSKACFEGCSSGGGGLQHQAPMSVGIEMRSMSIDTIRDFFCAFASSAQGGA